MFWSLAAGPGSSASLLPRDLLALGYRRRKKKLQVPASFLNRNNACPLIKSFNRSKTILEEACASSLSFEKLLSCVKLPSEPQELWAHQYSGLQPYTCSGPPWVSASRCHTFLSLAKSGRWSTEAALFAWLTIRMVSITRLLRGSVCVMGEGREERRARPAAFCRDQTCVLVGLATASEQGNAS